MGKIAPIGEVTWNPNKQAIELGRGIAPQLVDQVIKFGRMAKDQAGGASVYTWKGVNVVYDATRNLVITVWWDTGMYGEMPGVSSLLP